MRIALLTALSLVAFATNSPLCRLALGSSAIDARYGRGLRRKSG